MTNIRRPLIVGAELSIVVIIQARMGSNRFPGKVMAPLYEDSNMRLNVLDFMCFQIRKSVFVDHIIIATTTNKEDDIIENRYKGCPGVSCYRGSEDNVLKRVWEASETRYMDFIVEITADCPLIPALLINSFLDIATNGLFDYVSNTINRTFPDGLDIQVYTKEAFRRLIHMENNNIEHVGSNFLNHLDQFVVFNVEAEEGCRFPEWELTIDYPKDLLMLRLLLILLNEKFYRHGPFSWVYGVSDIINIIKEHPGLLQINNNLPRHAISNNKAINKIKE